MKQRTDDPTEEDWMLSARLEAVAALLRGGAAKDLREEALTPGAVTLLELAGTQPGATSSALAQQLGISRQAASKAVQGLVARGLLEAKAHPDDQRAQRITVTPTGRKALERSRKRRAPGLARVLEPLSARERAALSELLIRLHISANPAVVGDGNPED
ncbi:MAG: MarR family transcriptional regulator [Myxococcota bacterium]